MIANSRNPLSIGEDLYVECEIGLDAEIIDYIQESHAIQIKVGAEPFYLWARIDQGSLITTSITSWETTSSQYSAYIWTVSDGENNHPNSRMQQEHFKVFNNGVGLTRVSNPEYIEYDTEYALYTEVGTSIADAASVRIWFNSDFVPEDVAYSYRNICACVDASTGYPNRECPICKGTSYPAAFTQYTVAATKYAPADTVLVRVPMAAETLTPEQIGRVLRRDLRHWMLPVPLVHNFDLIMGTTGRNAGVMFEIVTKSDSRMRGILIHQEFNTVRLEETDIRYSLAPVSVGQTTTMVVAITSNVTIV